MRLLFGADRAKSGEITIDNRNVTIKSPVDAIKNGIGLLTEDRKHQGLLAGLSIKDNITITNLDEFLLDEKHLHEIASQIRQRSEYQGQQY